MQLSTFDVLLTVHLSTFISVINQLDAQKFCFTISLFNASTCFEHMCSSPVLSQPVHQTATYRCDDTRGCVMQFWPDDKHMCSKHVEARNKLIVKQNFCASSCLITEINIHILCSVTFFPENRPVYEKMWKNIVQLGRPRTKTRWKRIACWIPKATHTHTICNKHCFSTATMVARTRFIVTLPVSLTSPRCFQFSVVNVVAQFRHPWNNNGFIYFTFAIKIGDDIWLVSVWDDSQLQTGRCLRRKWRDGLWLIVLVHRNDNVRLTSTACDGGTGLC